MALNDEKHRRVEITAEEYQNLQQMLAHGNRLGMDLRLHELSGSQAALDMAQICSSSGLRGGVAWLINDAYTKTVPGYPKEGVEFFSKKIAAGDLELIQESFEHTHRYYIPTDLEMYQGALKTWNDIGRQSVPPNPDLGNHYFPGLPILAAHYLETGDVARFADLVRRTEPSIPLAASVPATGWEALTELVADRYNRSQTINDILDQRPDLTPRALRSPTGDEGIVFVNAKGVPEHVIRLDAGRNAAVDQPLGFVEKVADGLASFKAFDRFNDLGEWLGSTLPTPAELKEKAAQVREWLQERLGPDSREEATPKQDGKQGKGAEPKSAMDALFERFSQAAMRNDDAALAAVFAEHAGSPQGRQFQIEVNERVALIERQEREAAMEAQRTHEAERWMAQQARGAGPAMAM